MTRNISFLPGLVIAVGLTVCCNAMAHSPNNANIPVLRCWNADTEVVCASGRAQGSPIPMAILEIIDQHGKTIVTLKTDGKGRVRFVRPHEPFTVMLHDVRGNGQTVEVNQRDVDATKAADP